MVRYIEAIHNRRELCMSFAVKELLREAVDQLPEDATVEDAMDRLYFLAKVARGLEAADRGDVISHQEARSAILGDGAGDER
jgi:predicted transcriptional regulator